VKKWANIASEEEKMQALKSYMLSLPPEEFDRFMFWRWDDMFENIGFLEKEEKLSKSDKGILEMQIDDVLTKTENLKKTRQKIA
jgi:hypothetical protein